MSKAKLKLTKNHIRQWVKALRSGEYKQAQGNLCRSIGVGEQETFSFCCLGVACDLFLDAYWNETSAPMFGDTVWQMRGNAGMPPPSLQAELNRLMPGLKGKKISEYRDAEDGCQYLANKNDDGRSFKQIANIIEKAAGL